MDLPVREVLRPRALEEALALLAERPEARPIAGGTDLIVQLRDGRRRHDVLLDLSALPLSGIRQGPDGLEIGAGTTMDVLAESPEVRRWAPALSQAAGWVGAWPIQCRATLGGNLVNASPAADTVPALLLADTRVRLRSAHGERELELDRFLLGPGQTALAKGELLVSIRLPEPVPTSARETIQKLGPRKEQIIAVVSVAVRLACVEGRLTGVRVAMGAVAPTAARTARVEAALEGRAVDAVRWNEIFTYLENDIAPIDDVRAPAAYRRRACEILLRRIVEELTDG